MNRMLLALLGASLVVCPFGFAHAQQLSSDEMVKQLVPGPKTRSISGGAATRGIKVEGRKTENASLNLYINFEYDSDKLKQDAMIVLDQLAKAFDDGRLSKYDFLIAGHTDAVGSDAYNQNLSERRARSVKNYLEKRYGVAGSRLIEKGFGESRLLNPNDPNDGSNRRVQIITLSMPDQ